MSRTSRKLLPLAVAVAAAQATTVNAQQLEEVIVTAQKRSESLQDVPIAVTAFTGEQIDEAGVKDIRI